MSLVTTNDKSFELLPQETLLEALERTGHEVEYQCRQGYCGACRIKIRSGSVSYQDTPLAFLQASEILPCCCQVKENINIDCSLKPENQQLFEVDLFDD